MISCSQYDYIEIVCTYKYPIRITKKSGEFVECIAIDTSINSERVECIKVNQNGSEIELLLDDICELEVRVENPHFSKVRFDD